MDETRYSRAATFIVCKLRLAYELGAEKKHDEAVSVLKEILNYLISDLSGQLSFSEFIIAEMATVTSGGFQSARGQEVAFEEIPMIKRLKSLVADEKDAAVSMIKRGEYGQSYAMLKDVLPAYVALFGQDNRHTFECQLVIAQVLEELKQSLWSIELSIDIWNRAKTLLGSEDPYTLMVRSRLAQVLLRNNMQHEALNHFKEVFAVRSRILAPDDLELLMSQFHLASALFATRDLNQSLKMFRSALNKFEEINGPEHPMISTIQTCIGQVLLDVGEFFEAAKILFRVRDKQRSVPGSSLEDNKHTENCLKRLKWIVGPGKYAELEAQCAKAATLEHHKPTQSVNKEAVNKSQEHDANTNNNEGKAILLVAINTNDTKTVEAFLEYAKERMDSQRFNEFINAKTTSKVGNTALHIAACKGYLGPMRVLLRFGAIYNIKNNIGKTPYEQTEHEPAKNLLGLVSWMFEEAKVASDTVIDRLSDLEDEEGSAVMDARDESGQTLKQILVATMHKSSQVENLLKLETR